MKKKLIGISVATFGVVLSVGSAIALYQKAASNVEFGISAGAYAGAEGAITYKINNSTGAVNVAPQYYKSNGEDNEGLALGGEYTQIKYEFTLGAAFEDYDADQTFVMGKVSVALTDLDADLYGKVTVWAAVQGYTENTIGASSFGGALINDIVIADAETICAGASDISVAAAGVQKLVVWVKFAMAELDLFALNEKANLYALNVTWGKVSDDYVLAYIVGDQTHWTKDEKYSMAVNANADSFEWMYECLPQSFGEFKVVCGDTWCHADGENHVLAHETGDIYWTAGGDLNIAY